jgi:hypothetical protein
MNKSPLQSKTIRFHMAMIAIQSINGSLAMLQPFMAPEQFVAVSIVLGIAQSVGGVYLRFITSEAIK